MKSFQSRTARNPKNAAKLAGRDSQAEMAEKNDTL
jgi:hypothetical protein